MASLVAAETDMTLPLLFLVAHGTDLHSVAVAPALAAAAQRANWRFDCYVDRRRSGRHYGGGDPDDMTADAWAGSLVAGAHHAEHILWLSTVYDIVALGDPASPLWPALEGVGSEELARSADPDELYGAAFARLGEPIPSDVVVLDAAPQGPHRIMAAAYCAPAVLSGPPALALDVSCDEDLRSRVQRLGAEHFHGLAVDPVRAAAFPGGLESCEHPVGDDDYATFTASIAERHRAWGRGVLLGGPDLVAAQLPKLARLGLLPLHGQPQTDCIELAADIVRDAREPVYGVQYDDRDFFELARLGHGLQVIDPDPPFDAATALPAATAGIPTPIWDTEPSDDELRSWAAEGRVLVSLLFWAGMIRELDCIARVLDLIGMTGLRAGLMITAETVEHGGAYPLSLLWSPQDRGGAFPLVEPLLACTGRGVAAEALMPPGTLAASLSEAATATARRLPEGFAPRGWWPLLDAPLTPRRMPVGWRDGKPVLLTIGRNPSVPGPLSEPSGERATESLRSFAHRTGVRHLFGYRRPYDDAMPGPIDHHVAASVQGAGLTYMWTKSAFGAPSVPYRTGDFVALSFTAGRWDGWSPFYTLGSAADFVRAERRLLRSGRPGWLVSTIDTPLWAMSGEVWSHGTQLHELVELAARGGRSGKLINTTPHVVARYARLLDDLGLLA